VLNVKSVAGRWEDPMSDGNEMLPVRETLWFRPCRRDYGRTETPREESNIRTSFDQPLKIWPHVTATRTPVKIARNSNRSNDCSLLTSNITRSRGGENHGGCKFSRW